MCAFLYFPNSQLPSLLLCEVLFAVVSPLACSALCSSHVPHFICSTQTPGEEPPFTDTRERESSSGEANNLPYSLDLVTNQVRV